MKMLCGSQREASSRERVGVGVGICSVDSQLGVQGVSSNGGILILAAYKAWTTESLEVAPEITRVDFAGRALKQDTANCGWALQV